MDAPTEVEAVRTIAAKLADRFPLVPRSEVERIVIEEHHKLDGRPVRAYIAVLVEHAAKQRLLNPAPATALR
jgi:hypothetical protein